MRSPWFIIPAIGTCLVVLAIGVHLAMRAGGSTAGAVAVDPSSPPAVSPSALLVPTASVSDVLPMIGPDGVDAHGQPRRTVDRTALLALLRTARYAELSAHMETLQAAFEADSRNERWPTDAMFAFQSSDPALSAPIDAWVAATPRSFAPYLARCTHRDAIGWQRRGGAYSRETSREQMAGMREAFALARQDCERALEMRPGLVAARQRLLVMSHALGDEADAARQLESALAACPGCYGIRAVQLRYLTPRWGGSLGQMRAFAAVAARSSSINPSPDTKPGSSATPVAPERIEISTRPSRIVIVR